MNADGIVNANHAGQFWSEIWEFAKTAVSEIGKAAVITTTIAVAGIAAGALIGCFNLPVVFGAALTIGIGTALSVGEKHWKKAWIGY